MMSTDNTLQFEITIDPADLDEEQLESVTQTLQRQLHSLEAVTRVEREIETPAAGMKSGTGQPIPGKLKAVVNEIKDLIRLLGGYLPHNRIILEAKGKKLVIPGNRSQQEILELMEKARELFTE